MGNTCKPMAVSFQCMTKSTTIKKKKKNKERKKKTESVYCRGQNKSISLFKLKVDGKEIKLIGEDYSFTGFEIKSKERNKIVKGVTFLERKEKIYEAWI